MLLLCSPLARVLYVVLFDLKLLNKDSKLQVCMYCRVLKNEPQNPPEHASEYAKSPGCMSPDSPPQPILWAPLLVFTLGPSNPLGGSAYYNSFSQGA